LERSAVIVDAEPRAF
jgi:RNA-directed DNA polymerase